jgi:hypothetical protein
MADSESRSHSDADPTYGQDWIEFRLGGRIASSSDWKDVMVRWANISYQDNLSIGLSTDEIRRLHSKPPA